MSEEIKKGHKGDQEMQPDNIEKHKRIALWRMGAKPAWRYARRLTLRLAKETGLTVKVSQGFGATAWCKTKRCLGWERYQIYFGRTLLRKAYAFGIWVDADERLVWHSPGPGTDGWSLFTRLHGFESVYRIVVHEFAHVLNRSKENGSHNAGFYDELQFLATVCPFSEYGPGAVVSTTE